MVGVGKGKHTWKQSRKRELQLKDKSYSDDSDMDYMAEEDEVSDDGNELEDYCSSIEGDELEENLGGFEVEEEGKKGKKVLISKPKRGSSNRRKVGGKFSRNRRRVSYNEENDDGDFDFDDEEDNDEEFRPDRVDSFDEEQDRTVKKQRFSCKEKDEEFRPDGVDSFDEEEDRTGKRKRLSRKEEEDGKDDEEEEYNFNDDEEDYDFKDEDFDFDDEEFTPEEVGSLDEEKDMRVKKKAIKTVRKRVLRRKNSVKTQRRKRNPKVLKKRSRKKATRRPSLRRKVKNCDDDGFFTKKSPIMIESKKKPGSRNKRLVVQSDSDFVSSGPSYCNFTISEEEREQVREAGKLCKTLTATSRNSSSSKKIEETIDLKQPRKPPVRKGKEKVDDAKNEVVKHVCGICLSEEGKRTVRGTLNCCSHYFCFGCIMEWSKVESRCPLCKQRFVTISKPGKSNTGIDLRDVVTQVPERDQIYQPSEEEIRSYLDPYEHVMCTECQEGGDDNLMLLCDLCDSPSHTYCVGLGREVPEGNWYCEGCRPVALASLMSQAQHPLPSQIPIDINTSHRSSPSEHMEHGLDSSTMPSPFTRRGIGGLSPRYSFRDAFASPRSGAGVSTLSGRRDIHRRIHSLINNTRIRQVIERSDDNLVAIVGSDYPEFQVDRGIETRTYQLQRTPVAETSYFNFLGNPSTVQNGGFFPARSNNSTRQVTQEPFSATTDRDENGQLQTRSNLISSHEQHNHFSSGPFMDSDRDVSFFARGQVQSMVESYLKSIIGNLGLGHDSFTDISRKSTHTVLAAFGLEHQTSEVYALQQQPSLECSHVERMTDRQTSLVNGCCPSCFKSFVRHVVKTILNERLPPFLWVRD